RRRRSPRALAGTPSLRGSLPGRRRRPVRTRVSLAPAGGNARNVPVLGVRLRIDVLGLVVGRLRSPPPRVRGPRPVLLPAAALCVGFAAGLHFRPQYCLLLIAPLAIMAAVGVDALGRLIPPQPSG